MAVSSKGRAEFPSQAAAPPALPKGEPDAVLLPLVLELDGIWLSIVFAETMAVLVTMVFLLAKRKKYGY